MSFINAEERRMMSSEVKQSKAFEPYRVYCKKCGHTLFIADSKHGKSQSICKHCGTLNYSKKRNFREEMLKRLGGYKDE